MHSMCELHVSCFAVQYDHASALNADSCSSLRSSAARMPFSISKDKRLCFSGCLSFGPMGREKNRGMS